MDDGLERDGIGLAIAACLIAHPCTPYSGKSHCNPRRICFWVIETPDTCVLRTQETVAKQYTRIHIENTTLKTKPVPTPLIIRN